MKEFEEKLTEIVEFIENSGNLEGRNTNLFSGSAGIALFLFYYARYCNSKHYAKKAMDFLIHSVDNLNSNINSSIDHTFCEGISGLGWCIDHLVTNNFIDDANFEILQHFDNFLCYSAVLALSSNNNDFLHGAIGTAIYLLKRIQVPIVKKTLEDIINILNNKKICINDQLYWNYKIGHQLRDKVINLSLSHGMSSTCIFLIKARKLNINKLLTEELLEKSFRFLINQEIKHAKRFSMFPSYVLEQDISSNWIYSRLGWCYGDLGVALSVWHYSQISNNSELEKKAIEIFLFSSKRRNLEKNFIIDGGICHGTAGIALIFRRMYLFTKIEEFKEASEYWLQQTLIMAKYNDGFVGYKADERHPSIGILNGISGIGLVLLSFIANDEPKWDECLLLS